MATLMSSTLRRLNLHPLAVFVLLPAFGFTNCDEFDVVTVPEQDDLPPFAGTRIFRSEGDEVIRLDDTYIEARDFDEAFTVVPFGYDAGGLARLRMFRTVFVRCQGLPPTLWTFDDEIDEEQAAPGDQISNGRWLYFSTRPSELARDSSCRVWMNWGAEVRDVAGNENRASGTIYYAP